MHLSDAILSALPRHDGGLSIEHNPHRATHMTVAGWAEMTEPTWASDAARDLAFDADDAWSMQWYPDTAVGFHLIAAPTLAELLDLAATYVADRR